MRRVTAQEDQQEEESVHSFYVLIHVLIKLNLKPKTINNSHVGPVLDKNLVFSAV